MSNKFRTEFEESLQILRIYSNRVKKLDLTSKPILEIQILVLSFLNFPE